MDLLPADWIHAAAARHGERCALQCGQERLSYAAMARAIEQDERALAACGVGQGQVVAWLGLNSAAMLTMLFACARRGALFVPLNWRLAPPEHRAMLVECRPALFIAGAPFADASAAAEVAPAGTRCVALDEAELPAG
ncbi:MAG: AMP-binding protein, partial [Rubrivivax sp.]|nr:AMP-binding protein [Rubrivivax sp.]